MMRTNRPEWTRRQFIETTGAAAAGVMGSLAFTESSQAESSSPPNLVFVFSDQQSFDMLGCYGNEDIKTPRTDRFAEQGVRFEHCVSTQPLCTPYRGMLLSGLHPLYNGCFANDIQLLPGEGNSFAEVLKSNGYQTAYVGKWHLYGGNRDRGIPAGPHRHGFDDLFLTNNCTVDFRAGKCFYWNEAGEKVYFDQWEATAQTNQAIDFLKNRDTQKPFALFVSWHPPHDQGLGERAWRYLAPDHLMERYDPDKIRLRESLVEHEFSRLDYHGYYAMCSGCDDEFGRILDTLDDLKLSDNTLVVYTSDHGDTLSSHNRQFPKMYPEDVSARVPMVMRFPGKLKPRVSELPIGTLDLMPTLLSLLNITPPARCQGDNLAGAICREDDSIVDSRPMFYFGPSATTDRSWYGVYTPEHTFSFSLENPYGESDLNLLYQRSGDPEQLKNVYENPGTRTLRESLRRRTREWMKRFDDPGTHGTKVFARLWGPDKRYLYFKEDTGILSRRPIEVAKEIASE